MSADEAATHLGIRRATLYAYVSRGWIESVPGRGRSRLYSSADVERLRARSEARSGHGPVAAAALRFGEPVIASEITAITGEGPRYRGQGVCSMVAEGISYESVAELLWGMELPLSEQDKQVAKPWTCPRLGIALRRLESGLPEAALPLDVLRLALPVMGAKEGMLGLGIRAEKALAPGIIVRLAALCGLVQGVERVRAAAGERGLARILAHALGGAKLAAHRQRVALIEAALLLSADHGLNTSTFAARVVASTGADLFACLTAAICALSGPLHGGACLRVEGLLDEARSQKNVADVVRLRGARGEAVPGFGHALYAAGDPRAMALLDLAATGGSGEALRTMRAIADAMADAGHPAPSLDFGLVAVAESLSLPRGSAAALFAIGRSAGWVAHIIEQRRQGFLLRPTARYVGPGAIEPGTENRRDP
ncbi:MAG TPA: helix-turn-helix domain-containing protein [Nannocystis exedens]|nr:helix-turn-helix domain-containing protein [Nannocystis exedens]